ncbi:MaoC family dehydratase [Aquabacter cavernae]|uniref:MaoC family dehydratase n=1 Tax=Aquabacter cavernae TaxID=2496029 RepID=UPI000F8D81DC|nr:MaoC family dehydratase [Aquabacter cavernae]
MSYFDEMQVGTRRVLGSHLFTRDEIIAFARNYDPQTFHVDEEAAKRSPFGALIASGWHTAATWMKYLLEERTRDDAERRARGLPVPDFGPSPGFKNLRWLKPVYAGDTITYATEVREKLPSKSKPEWGLLMAYNTGTNQHGDLVFDFESTVFVRRRA